MSEQDDTVTGLIRAWAGGNAPAGDRLFSLVYEELRTIARRQHRRWTGNADDTLDTTALVHEVYLRLRGASELQVRDRAHFYAVASRAARQIVSNYARRERTLKRGAAAGTEPLEPAHQVVGDAVAVDSDTVERMHELEEALQRLEALHPRPCRVVECRYFGGMSIPETAIALDISEATVKRDWMVAQAWLHRALRETEDSLDG